MSESAKGHLAMLLFSMLIAGSFGLGSLAAPHIAPAALNAMRFLIAALVVGLLALLLGKLPKSAFAQPWRYLVLGGLFTIYFVTMFEALKTVTAVSTAAVFTLTPFIAALFGRVILHQRLSAITLGALLIGAMGSLWVIFRADLEAFLAFDVGRGEVIFFFGCIAHALYPTATRRLTAGEPALAVNFGMLSAGLILLCLYGWTDIRQTDWLALPMIVWVTIFYTAIVAGVTTFTLLQYASFRLPGGKVMAYTYLVPAWVTLWSMALGIETPPARIFVGVVLIAMALLILLRTKEKTG